MLLGHRALVGFKSPEALAETKAFVRITALPVETSDWFMTDRSAGLASGLTYAARVVHAAICVKLFKALSQVCIVL